MRHKNATTIIFNTFGIIVAVASIFPLVWMAISGMKPEAEVLATPFRFLPKQVVTENYQLLLEDPLFFRSVLTTFAVATVACFSALLINSMGAFVFARLEFPFKKLLWGYVILTMYIPNIAILITSFVVVAKLGMLNHYSVLILPGLASAYSVFFIRQFYLNVPSSLEEAALIDGATRFGTYRYIFLPLSKSPFVIIGISTFLGYWNSFIWPIMTISDEKKYQVMQVVAYFRSAYVTEWGRVLAASTLAAIPTITLFLIFQRHIIQGIKISGIK